jgi:ATP-dependent protease ClpP protease subunit
MQIYAKSSGPTAKSADLYIIGNIADTKFWGDEITLKDVMDAMADIPSHISELHVRVNSYGGSLAAGTAMKSEILTRKQKEGFKIITHAMGVAASMGTVMMILGEERLISEGALYLVHYPISGVYGNSMAHEQAAEELKKMNEDFIAMYMRVFKGTEQELRDLMAKETWLSAQEAVDYGFCTGIENRIQVSASKGGYTFGNTFVPGRMVAMATSKIQPNSKGGENEMFLNEDTQKQLEACFGTLTGVDVKSVVLTQNADGTYAVKAEEILPPPTVFLTAEQVQAKAGKDMTADDVLGMFDTVAALEKEIGDYKSQNPVDKAKVAAYDKLFFDAKAEALKNGIKAKGDKFDNERWDKLLAGMSLDDIKAQADEWLDEGKKALHAGKRVSSSTTGEAKNAVPDEAYKL